MKARLCIVAALLLWPVLCQGLAPPAASLLAENGSRVCPLDSGVTKSETHAQEPNRAAVATPVAVPTAPLAPSSHQVAPGSAIVAQFALQPDFAPGPKDWVTLVKVGNSDLNYGPWLYNRTAVRQGELNFTAPTEPGWYEFRYYPSDGFQLYQRSTPFMVSPPPQAGEITLTLGPMTTPETRVANMRALQALADRSCAEGFRLTLPSGDLYVNFTDEKRSVRVWNRLIVASAGKTVLHMGPDLPTWTGQEWSFWKIEPGSFRFEILSGVDVEGALYQPDAVVKRTLDASAPDSPAPGYLWSVGSKQPGLDRHIFVSGVKVSSDPKARRGIDTAFNIEADVDGSSTEFHLADFRIDTLGQALAAFGSGGEIYVERGYAVCGWLYGPISNGYGNVLYVHQGRSLYVSDCTLVTRFGRDAIKYAGVRSEGRGKSAKIVNCIFRCIRPESLRKIGYVPTPADEHWGNGIGFDKFAECAITNCYFESSLWIAIQHFGKVNVQGGTVEAPYVFGGAGDQTGEKPIIHMSGTHCFGVRNVMYSTMESATWVFDGVVVDTDRAETLFSTQLHPQRVYINGGLIRLQKGGQAFHNEAQEWKITTPVIQE